MSLLPAVALTFTICWCHYACSAVKIPACGMYSTRTIRLPNVNRAEFHGYQNFSSIQFELTTNLTLNCRLEQSSTRKIRLDLSNANSIDEPLIASRNYKTNVSVHASSQSHFTSSGHFFDNETSTYYRPNGDYCIESFTENEATIKVCTVDKYCNSSSLSKVWCIPKCCAIDEVFLFWDKRCVSRIETKGATPWLPELFKGPSQPHDKISKPTVLKNILYQLAYLPANCAQVESLENGSQSIYYLHASGADVKHFGNDTLSVAGIDIKLTTPTSNSFGQIRGIALNYLSRKWKHIEKIFCVDGYSNQPKNTIENYTGNSNEFIFIYCDSDEYDKQTDEQSSGVSWAYFGISLVALLFLTAILVVYLSLWKEQNLHGMTILSYTLATLGSYLFLAVAHLISLYPESLGDKVGLGQRGFPCYLIAVLAHYFYFASYMWLTTMNVDLWLTFKNMRMVNWKQKEWGHFICYSLVSWIAPLLLVLSFVWINEHYLDPVTEFPVPNYTETSCFISVEFRGEYLYTPVGIFLTINILLIISTLSIFVKARRKKSGNSNQWASKNSGYSAKLFLKLFVVMGGTSLVDIISWYYNNKTYKHTIVVVLESISYLQPLALFIIFCLNSRVINQLRKKYPNFLRRLDMLLNRSEEHTRDYNVGPNEVSTDTNKTSYLMDTFNRRR